MKKPILIAWRNDRVYVEKAEGLQVEAHAGLLKLIIRLEKEGQPFLIDAADHVKRIQDRLGRYASLVPTSPADSVDVFLIDELGKLGLARTFSGWEAVAAVTRIEALAAMPSERLRELAKAELSARRRFLSIMLTTNDNATGVFTVRLDDTGLAATQSEVNWYGLAEGTTMLAHIRLHQDGLPLTDSLAKATVGGDAWRKLESTGELDEWYVKALRDGVLPAVG